MCHIIRALIYRYCVNLKKVTVVQINLQCKRIMSINSKLIKADVLCLYLSALLKKKGY